MTSNNSYDKLPANMMVESDLLPTTFYLVRQGIIRPSNPTTPWKGEVVFDGVPTQVELGWEGGRTTMDISNRFSAERWEMDECYPYMVSLKKCAAGMRRLLLGSENQEFDWLPQATLHQENSYRLYFKSETNPHWQLIPRFPSDYPPRLRENIAAPRGSKPENEVTSLYMRLREILDSADPTGK